MRVVIELKRGELPEVVLNNLYKHTQLQDTFGMNMVALVDGQPRLLNLKQIIESFLSHRREVVTRRTVFELRKARRARPRARGPGRRAGQHRRLHRHHQGRADAAGRQGRAGRARAGIRRWCARCWRAPRQAGSAAMFRPEGLDPRARAAGRRHLPAVRGAGRADPADAPAAPDRPGAGQDRRRVPRRHGADRRPARHPGAARSASPPSSTTSSSRCATRTARQLGDARRSQIVRTTRRNWPPRT